MVEETESDEGVGRAAFGIHLASGSGARGHGMALNNMKPTGGRGQAPTFFVMIAM